MTHSLSKSRFVAGLHCPLRLWYLCHHPELASPVSPAQQAVFDTGHEVGRLATHLYPGGVLIDEDHLHHEQAVQRTLSVIEDKQVSAIYEAAFVYDDVRVRVDILERRNHGNWGLIEVKSSTSIKEAHLPDVAVQCHVLKGSGLTIEQCGVLHLNRDYAYDGRDLQIASLFSFSDLTEQVAALHEGIPRLIAELKQILSGTAPPDIMPSRVCKNPYSCEFWEHCIRDKPDFWVMKLFGITQKRIDELAELHVLDIRDIPNSFPLTRLQKRIRGCVLSRKEYIAPELEAELNDVEYPVHFLDFETISHAIPRYASTRPYQAIPFQWSDHILFQDQTVEHRQYLCLEDKDPRGEFSTTLLEALGKRGTVFAYTDYEKSVIRELAQFFPDYRSRLLATLDRFKDLHALVKRYTYHPEFHGSFSLKSVLPALVPYMRYDDLAIQDGRHASAEYLRMLKPGIQPHTREEIKQALLRYCSYDTLGMLKIREEMLKRTA
jgi:hypothetical protein